MAMAKMQGTVGYGLPIETSPGIWEDSMITRPVVCEVTRFNSRLSSNANSSNDDFSLNVQCSFIADAFAIAHFSFIKYIEYLGTKWKITGVEVQRPRLILTLGGVYNG
jgi:hypothetical protein